MPAPLIVALHLYTSLVYTLPQIMASLPLPGPIVGAEDKIPKLTTATGKL